MFFVQAAQAFARRCAWVVSIALVFALSAHSAARAQQQGRARIAGRVLDGERGVAVDRAIVRLTALDTRAWTVDTTAADGRYSVALPPGTGPFALRAERIGYAPLTAIVAAADLGGESTWRDLRLTPQAVVLAAVAAVQRRPERESDPRRTPGGGEATTLSWTDPGMPVEPGDLAGAAGLQPGVRGGEDGISFHGLDPQQARVTLDGAAYGSASLPKEAVSTVSVVSSAYDVSRGEFSSGLVAATTLSGTNLFGAAIRARGSPSALQWRPGPGSSPGPASFASLDAGIGGPLLTSRIFWYGAISGLVRRSLPASLESASPALLGRLGVPPDSAAAVLETLRSLGAPVAAAGTRRSAGTVMGTGLLRVDYDLSPHHSAMLRLSAGATDVSGLGRDALSTSGGGATLRDRNGAVLAQIDSRVGPLSNVARAYATAQSNAVRPDGRSPTGIVLVQGDSGAAVPLRFGGNPASWEVRRSRAEVADEMTLAVGPSHELRAGTAYTVERLESAWASNAAGTFTFRSLADLRAGTPASYARASGTATGSGSARLAALYVGDTWDGRPLSVTFGVRAERRSYGRPDAATPTTLSAFRDARPGIGSEWSLSPRLGWTLARSGFALRGGVGRFVGTIPPQSLGDPVVATGAEIACIGPAAPAPAWEAYAADPASVPTSCVAGAPAFTSRAPSANLFDARFAAPRTWQASLAGNTSRLEPFVLRAEASLTVGTHQPLARDANLAPLPAFTLAAEGGREVYAPAEAIDPRTGAVAVSASRLDPAWGIVRAGSSSGRATVQQLTLGFYYPYRRAGVSPRISVDGAYTFTRARDDAGPLGIFGGPVPYTDGAPRSTPRGADREIPHDVLLRVTYQPVRRLRLGILARLSSGLPFTPRVEGDVNGDGVQNDAAFVFDPRTSPDASVRAGMERLLGSAPDAVHDCLVRELGRVARRNACRGGWSPSLDVRAELTPLSIAAQRRLQIFVSTTNALGAVDRILHGQEHLRGWGTEVQRDASLLRVTGFDRARNAFQYEVNPRFGRPGRSGSAPFRIAIEGRVTIGDDPAYQPLQRVLNRHLGPGRSADELRLAIARTVPNPSAQLLAGDSAWGLRLTPEQRQRLADGAERLGERVAPLGDSLAVVVSAIETGKRRGSRAAWNEVRGMELRIRAELERVLEELRGMLTASQWARVPQDVQEPPAHFVPDRPLRGRSGP